MDRTVLITGADRGLGLGLAGLLLSQGWHVLAGQYFPAWPELTGLLQQYPQRLNLFPLDVASMESVQTAACSLANQVERLDVLINNAGVNSPTNERSIREGLDYADMHRLYDINALGPLRVVEAFLPILDRGGMKRLCFVSSEAGSIGRMTRTAWQPYCMSKAALNMGIQILFNRLHPEGYTFRVYHPGWVRSYMGGQKNNQADLEPEQAAAYAIPFFLNDLENEDHLSLIDYQGQTWPW